MMEDVRLKETVETIELLLITIVDPSHRGTPTYDRTIQDSISENKCD